MDKQSLQDIQKEWDTANLCLTERQKLVVNKWKDWHCEQAKKVVLDELLSKSYNFNEWKLPQEEIRESMKRHLSTFSKRIDIIIADK